MSEPRQRRQRTPEEIAKSLAIAKAVMEKQKKKDGIDAVVGGRTYVFIAAVFYVIHALFMYYYKAMEDLYLYAGLTVLFIILGIFYKRNPFVISIISFTFFMVVILLQALVDPATLFGGILFFFLKVTVIVGLIASMKNALKYKRELELESDRNKQSDVLDEGLIDFNQ